MPAHATQQGEGANLQDAKKQRVGDSDDSVKDERDASAAQNRLT
jgi:hypothetical protein